MLGCSQYTTCFFFFFFFNDTATTEIYTLSLHDALPILRLGSGDKRNQLRVYQLGICSKHAGNHVLGKPHAFRPLDQPLSLVDSTHCNHSLQLLTLARAVSGLVSATYRLVEWLIRLVVALISLGHNTCSQGRRFSA